jgi:hypothetical protein
MRYSGDLDYLKLAEEFEKIQSRADENVKEMELALFICSLLHKYGGAKAPSIAKTISHLTEVITEESKNL